MNREEKKEARLKRIADMASAEKLLKASYWKVKDEPAFLDLQKFLLEMSAYHVKIAKDGLGFENKQLPDGSIEQVPVKLDNSQKLDHLQRSAGLEEALDYIARKLTIKPESSKKEKSDE